MRNLRDGRDTVHNFWLTDDSVKTTKNQQTARYVIFHYPQFMTSKERLAYEHLIATYKAAAWRSEGSIPEAVLDSFYSESISTDPEVLSLASGGWEKFLEQTAARILSEHGADIYLNRCPKCGEVTVTPKARQCRYCLHDWHE